MSLFLTAQYMKKKLQEFRNLRVKEEAQLKKEGNKNFKQLADDNYKVRNKVTLSVLIIWEYSLLFMESYKGDIHDKHCILLFSQKRVAQLHAEISQHESIPAEQYEDDIIEYGEYVDNFVDQLFNFDGSVWISCPVLNFCEIYSNE